jgi:hypothetical protein
MPDFSLVQRRPARDLYSPLTHIAKRAEYGPCKTANHALCGFAAPEGWVDETILTLAGVKTLRDGNYLCEECDAQFSKRRLT